VSAVFVDLDRTLLRGPSGPVLDLALRRRGVVPHDRTLPGARALYAFYGRLGENLVSMGLARAAAVLAGGWLQDDVRAAAEEAVPELAALVAPFAPAALHGHRADGRKLVLATTTPEDMVTPLAQALGFDAVVATRYGVSEGRYTGHIEGPFVWGLGKLAAIRRWAESAGESLADCHAYSDSVYDAPLLSSVGHPHALNPDPRLHALAVLRRWPVEHWDRPPGVPSIVGLEPYHFVRLVVRRSTFPYARFDIRGIDLVPRVGGVIVASNHRSYFDAVALALVARELDRPVRFLAKRELFSAPAVGWVLRAIGGIPVDRGSGSRAPLEAAEASLRAGEVVVILPEGTIPRGEAAEDSVLHGRTGVARLAAATGAPVIPVGLWGTERVWPREAKFPNLVGFHDVSVRVGPAVSLGLDDAAVNTERIMAAIAALIPAEERPARGAPRSNRATTVPPGC
jgi:putative phosphoserine phosphatase / 1-acylglycerol-3-phosphate O-acyltransferase